MGNLELVLDAKATLGEGPSWDSTNQVLYWIDIMNHEVHIFNPLTGHDVAISVGQYVGAAVPRKSGGLILALQHGFYELDLSTKAITAISDKVEELSGNRFNDGKCDAAGRFWAGTMDIEESKSSGSLYVLNTDLSVKKMIDNVSISNGLAWAEDNQTMYYIDSPTRQVVAYDYNLGTSTIKNKRIVVTFPEGGGIPDGMTIDAEGMLWVAEWNGSCISRWNPQTGELISKIDMPVSRVTSCVFGGERLDELYITTARVGLSEAELKEQPQAGGLFKIKTNTQGFDTQSFRG